MLPNSRWNYTNILTFATLLLSWWAVGVIVAREAVRNDGRFFDTDSPLIAGAYYNDWLPVITTVALGLGLGIGLFVASLNKTISRSITFEVLFLFIGIPALCLAAIFGIRNSNPAFAQDFIEPAFMLFLFGTADGLFFRLLQRFETLSND